MVIDCAYWTYQPSLIKWGKVLFITPEYNYFEIQWEDGRLLEYTDNDLYENGGHLILGSAKAIKALYGQSKD